jgi:signal recognition particle subunit SRP54
MQQMGQGNFPGMGMPGMGMPGMPGMGSGMPLGGRGFPGGGGKKKKKQKKKKGFGQL